MITIVDTYREIEQLAQMGSFDRARWQAYADGIYSGLSHILEEDAAGYDFDREVRPVLEDLFAHMDRAEEAHRSFCKAVKALEANPALARQGPVDSQVILYLGLCNGAGWAAALGGRPVILLGLEKIVELGWTDEKNMAALIWHELGHNWHFQNRRGGEEQQDWSAGLWQLYTEGMAMYYEQTLYGSRDFFHQDKEGWLDWCKANRSRLATEYLRRLEAGESIQEFFGDWCSLDGHSDVGYYLGARTVDLAAQERSPRELLNLTQDQFVHYLCQLAEQN